MREPHPDWSSLGVNFKILDEHPHLSYISSQSPPPPPGTLCLAEVKKRLLSPAFNRTTATEQN